MHPWFVYFLSFYGREVGTYVCTCTTTLTLSVHVVKQTTVVYGSRDASEGGLLSLTRMRKYPGVKSKPQRLQSLSLLLYSTVERAQAVRVPYPYQVQGTGNDVLPHSSLLSSTIEVHDTPLCNDCTVVGQIVHSNSRATSAEGCEKMTSIRSNDIPFWKRPSSFVVTAVRVVVLVLVHASPFPSWSILGDWLYSPSLTSILIKPSYTLSHVREAMAIQNLSSGRSSDAYKAHPRIQMPPLLLAALTPLAKTDHAEFYLALFCLLLDLALATMVEHIGRTALFTNRIEEVDEETKEQGQLPESIRAPNSHIFAIDLQCKDDSIISMESLPSMAAQLYYWSLVTTASGSLYACFQMLPGFFLVAAFYESLRRHGSPFLSTFLLAVATYLELHHVAFLFPLSFLPSTRNRRAFVVFTFVFWFVCLQGLSYQLTGPSMFGRVLEATYGLGWRTVRPSLSVQWYLAMQLFSRFREYFRVLLLGLPYIAVMPITTRLHKYPIVLVRERNKTYSTAARRELTSILHLKGGDFFHALEYVPFGRDIV